MRKPQITTYKRADRAHHKSKKVKATLAKANETRLNKGTATPLSQEEPASSNAQLTQEEVTTPNTITGCRIMNMEQLCESVGTLTSHSAQCGGKCLIEGESMHSVILQASCSKCHKIFSIRTSPRIQTAEGKTWSANIGAVLGEMLTGGGLAQLNTTLAMMDVPGMHRRMFTEIEEFIGSEMTKQLAESIREGKDA